MSANHPQTSQEWATTAHRLPLSFSDHNDREIEIDVYGEYLTGDEFDPLVGLYGAFNPADRELGLPPIGGKRIREWLETLLEGHNVLAWHDDVVAGHTTLLKVRPSVYELGIFVHRAYQHAGIEFQLLMALLEYGKQNGVESVRLFAERQQTAVKFYRKTGFKLVNSQGFELKMVQEL